MDLEKKTLRLGDRPGLLIVDMIKGFTDPACPLGTDCPQVVAANKQLLAAFRAGALPIFFTTVIYRNAQQAKVFRQKVPALNVLQADSPWVEVDPALQRREDEPLLEKNWASAFFDTDLAQRLRADKVDSLVVAGLTTSGCVRATVVDALQHDFAVFVPKQAVGDRNPAAHQANLFDISAKYGEVPELEQVLAHVQGLAG
ncbi:MAG: isochorismatase family protein [Gammaproteobacteria bacterium]